MHRIRSMATAYTHLMPIKNTNDLNSRRLVVEDDLEINELSELEARPTSSTSGHPEVINPSSVNQAKHVDIKEPEITQSQNDTVLRDAYSKTPIENLKVILFYSYANVLLVFVPVGIAVHIAKVNPTVVFVMNFLAIFPLAGLLSFATEEISIKVGQTLGGLLNASFGNAVEIIVGIIALVQNQIIIVQASLLGSMLSNLLLVLGMCFFIGGLRYKEQVFNTTVAQTASGNPKVQLAVSLLIYRSSFDFSCISIDTSCISCDS